jgi:hypothetical protein
MPVDDPQALYGLPLDRFVPERTALSKALRGAGQRERAVAVAALRKPSVAAWAVNQLIRTQKTAVAALFAAGDLLQQAQAEVLAGAGDAGSLRDAAAEERAALDELVGTAGGLLSSQGHELSPTTLERITETLHAAALDEAARAQVQDGCLERELRHVGLGAGGFAPQAAVARERPAPRQGKAGKEGGRTDRAAEAKAARKAEAEARKAETEARHAAERAGRELRAAQQRRDRAAEALTEAEQGLAEARSRAEEAEGAHQRAKDALSAGG